MTEQAPFASAAPESSPRPGGLRRALLYLLAFGVMTVAVTLFLAVLLTPQGSPLFSGAALYLAFEVPLAGATLRLTQSFWRRLDRLPTSRLGYRAPSPHDLLLAGVVALAPTLGGLGIDLVTGHARIVGVAPGGTAAVHLALYTALGLMVGLAEETPFRGYLLPNLTQSLGTPAAILITSVLFAAMHLTNPEHQKLMNMVELTLAGVGFALLRLGTGSLTVPILAHACYDFTLFVSGTNREFQGVLRTEIGPNNLWLGGQETSGLVGILLLIVWIAALWRWVYLPRQAEKALPTR